MINLHPVPSDEFCTMDDDALAAAVSTLAAHIHAATYRLLVLIAELDRREVWAAHGERIDYDHALMVTMASWDSGDTRPEAGPAAGDWNPS